MAGLALSLSDPFTVLFYVSNTAVGAMLVLRRPRNAIGWLLLATGVGFIGTTRELTFPAGPLVDGSAPLDEFLWVWVSAWSGYATFTSLVTLTILYPSGRFPSGRWRPPAIASVIIGAAVTAIAAAAPEVAYNRASSATFVLVPNRFAILPDSRLWALVPIDLLMLPLAAMLAGAAIGMIVRYRRSAGIVRLQLRWLVASISLVATGAIAGLLSSAVLGDIGGLAWLGTILGFPLVPASVYVAVTRYRLYEIDRIISRTIAWAATTALVAAVFALVIVSLQGLLAPVTSGSTLSVAASTLLAAAMFGPVQRRVQATVDRRFNRTRVDGLRALDGFAARLRDEVALETLQAQLLSAVGEVVEPRTAAVWTRTTRRA